MALNATLAFLQVLVATLNTSMSDPKSSDPESSDPESEVIDGSEVIVNKVDVSQRVATYAQQLYAAVAKSDSDGGVELEQTLGLLLVVLKKKDSIVADIASASPLVRSLSSVIRLGPPRTATAIKVLLKLTELVSGAHESYVEALRYAFQTLHAAGSLSDLSDVASSPARLEALRGALSVGEKIAQVRFVRRSSHGHSEDSGSDDESYYRSDSVISHFKRSGRLCVDALCVLSQMLISETPRLAASGTAVRILLAPVQAILSASITLRALRTLSTWNVLLHLPEGDRLPLDRLYPALIEASRACTALGGCVPIFETWATYICHMAVSVIGNVFEEDDLQHQAR